MSEEKTRETDDLPAVAKANQLTDDLVEATLDVGVVPGEGVSAHFRVTPASDDHAILSVTVSFVEKKDGMLEHSFAGASVHETSEPRKGQGARGDAGVDLAVFSGRGDGELYAVLAGTVDTADGPRNFHFDRRFEI